MWTATKGEINSVQERERKREREGGREKRKRGKGGKKGVVL